MKGVKPKLVVDNDPLNETPSPTSWLSKRAKQVWRETVPALIERKILTEADIPSFENYCIWTGRVRELQADIEMSDNPDMKLKLSRAQLQATKESRLFAAELGLTPVSRSRPKIRKGGDNEADPLNFS